MDLREYEQSKFAIAEILRAASTCVPEQRIELHEHLRNLFVRLAEDRFKLVFIGRFNRGKTSLMNALLATDRLPTGIVPLTSVITAVGYGSKERVILKYQSRGLDSEIPLQALPQHVTQQGNPGNVQGITRAEIQLPAEILRRGFYFVDTPGLGSAIVENTLTTEAFLPEADAFVLVTSYESPLSEEEVRFFKAATISGRRPFIVLNKHDTVSTDEQAAVLDFTREQLGAFFTPETPPIFSVSSTDGLRAKQSGDAARLNTSGIPELEAQLFAFLLGEKSSVFLARTCDRVRKFLHELPPSAKIESLAVEIDDLVRQFSQRDQSLSLRQVGDPAEAFPNLHRLSTCEICAQIANRLWNFLSKYQYELIINSGERQSFANRGGLCPFHAWQLQSVASPYGMCVGYPPLLDRLSVELNDLASGAFLEDVPKKLAKLVPNDQECALCDVRNGAEKDAVAATVRRLKESGERAINSLSAICLPHVALLAAAIQDGDLARSVLKRQAAILRRYAEDMRRYAVKHDAVRRYLASQEETTAAERGLLLVSGRRQVNSAPRER